MKFLVKRIEYFGYISAKSGTYCTKKIAEIHNAEVQKFCWFSKLLIKFSETLSTTLID